MKEKEKEPAATDKTSFLQDSTQERAAQDRPAPVVRFPNLPCTWVPVEYYGPASWLNSAAPEHNVKAFLGTAGRGETWARFKQTEPQMAWDASSIPTGRREKRRETNEVTRLTGSRRLGQFDYCWVYRQSINQSSQCPPCHNDAAHPQLLSRCNFQGLPVSWSSRNLRVLSAGLAW